jgi:hypothetical protein
MSLGSAANRLTEVSSDSERPQGSESSKDIEVRRSLMALATKAVMSKVTQPG